MDRLVTEVLSDARKEWKHLSTRISIDNMDLGTVVLALVAVFMVYVYFQRYVAIRISSSSSWSFLVLHTVANLDLFFQIEEIFV